MKVTAKVEKPGEGISGDPVSVEYNFGDSLQDMVANFGEEVIQSRARASLVIDLQALIRRQINAKKSVKEIQQAVKEWKPGVKAAGKTPAEKLQALLDGKTKEEKLAILKEAGLV